jgi:co-chaperonin GroES (HSP10)
VRMQGEVVAVGKRRQRRKKERKKLFFLRKQWYWRVIFP